MDPRPPTHPDHADNGSLRRRVEDLFSGAVTIDDHSRTFGRMHVVWRLTTNEGMRYFAKRHESPLHFERAWHAHQHWFPRLGHVDGLILPHACAIDPEHGLIVAEEIQGQIVDELAPRDQVEAMRIAGCVLRAIHDIDEGRDEEDPEASHRAMAAKYTDMLAGAVSAAEEAWIRAVVSDTSIFRSEFAVATHGDFSPRNWILRRTDEGVTLGVIDWERARHMAWIHDVVRMTHDHWTRTPEGRCAFFEGYGRHPSEVEERQMLWSTALMAGASIAWAMKFEDRHYERLNRALLARLMAEHRIS